MTKERQEKIERVLANRQGNLTVVLENVHDPHNISAVMRSCDAVGVQEIYVLNTNIPQNEKWGVISSSSSYKWLTIHQHVNIVECITVLKSKYEKILTTHLSSDAVSLYEADLTGRLALVFGNERDGVSEELLALSDGNFIIPQVGMIRSLNISVACAVTLYEAYRQKHAAGQYDQQSLTVREYSLISKQWGLYNEVD